MGFESKFIKDKNGRGILTITKENMESSTGQPSKVKAILHVDNGRPEVAFKVVPKFTLKLDELNDQPIFGTELFFEGRLFYPVVWAQKGPQGWCVTKPDFMILDEMFFFNPHLKKEESELDLQGFFKTLDPQNWKAYMEELNEQAFQALKFAFGDYIKKNSTVSGK